MIDDKAMTEFITKLKKIRGDQFTEIVGLINEAWRFNDERGNPEEITKTILEIVEPERIGRVRFLK